MGAQNPELTEKKNVVAEEWQRENKQYDSRKKKFRPLNHTTVPL